MIQLDKEFINLIKGKKVAIVGPSSHLIGTGLGEFIDSYDVVSRPNYFAVSKELECDYGSRTDVLFHSLDPKKFYINEFHNQSKEYSEAIENIKAMYCPWYPHPSWNTTGYELYDTYTSNLNVRPKPYFISEDDYDKCVRKTKGALNTGIISIMILLECKPKDLFVTGYSFYSQFKKSVKECYYPLKKTYEFNPLISHPQNIQKTYFNNEILGHHGHMIKIDSCLNSVLGINHSNIKNLNKNE